MALIKCSKCGKEISSMATECQYCGVPMATAIGNTRIKPPMQPISRAKQEKESSKIFEETKRCPFCGEEILAVATKCRNCKENLTRAPESHFKNSKKKRSPFFSIVITGSIVLALIISFFGYKMYENIIQKSSQDKFKIAVSKIAKQIVTVAGESESIVNEINREWHGAIYGTDGYSKRDFNIAIFEVKNNRSEEIKSINEKLNGLKGQIAALSPPINNEIDYKRVKEIYLLVAEYAGMATDPLGSLQSYSKQNIDLKNKITSAIREIELLLQSKAR